VVGVAFVVFSVLTFLLVGLTALVAGIVRTFSRKRVYKHRR
jgi:hypothetical protein